MTTVEFPDRVIPHVESYRRRAGWSKAELARRTGMNGVTIGMIESGRFIPYQSQVEKLISALDLTEDEATYVRQRHLEVVISNNVTGKM